MQLSSNTATEIYELSTYILNDVKVVKYSDGSEKFFPIENLNTVQEKIQSKPWYQRLIDWYNTAKIVPYIKGRDLSDPFEREKTVNNTDNYGSKHGIEVGIKINF